MTSTTRFTRKREGKNTEFSKNKKRINMRSAHLRKLRDAMTGMRFGSFIKKILSGDKARTQVCKEQQGNIVVKTQSLLRIWENHFCRLLDGDEDTNSTVKQNVPFKLDDDQEYRPAGEDDLNDELFKAAGYGRKKV